MLGIAVLGSLVASAYRSDLAVAVDGLPAESVAVAESSLGGALDEAGRLGGDVGATLATAARSAYTDAMSTALFIAAAVTLVAIVVVQRALPRQPRPPGVRTAIISDLEVGIGPMEPETASRS